MRRMEAEDATVRVPYPSCGAARVLYPHAADCTVTGGELMVNLLRKNTAVLLEIR